MPPLPDFGDAVAGIAVLSPAAQIVALLVLGVLAAISSWARVLPRRAGSGADIAIVVDALKLTAQAQLETAASIATIARQVEAVAHDVRTVAADLRSLTARVVPGQSPAER